MVDYINLRKEQLRKGSSLNKEEARVMWPDLVRKPQYQSGGDNHHAVHLTMCQICLLAKPTMDIETKRYEH